jgi:hypothetical protein
MDAGPFARGLERMNKLIANRLATDIGSFQSPGQPPVEDLPLRVVRNLEMVGPDGHFQTDMVGITFYRGHLATASRGDIFRIGTERFMVEKLIDDDGSNITAATMVHP